jgi:hypothetical protein
MRQIFGLLFLGVAASACGAARLEPVAAAPSNVDSETRALPQKPQREIPRLLAPPPAYGNKIVMARAEHGVEAN